MKRLAGCIVLVLAGALVASCDSSDPDTVTNSDSNTMVLINADVVTMDDSTPTATAIAWSGENILAVGSEESGREMAGDGASG